MSLISVRYFSLADDIHGNCITIHSLVPFCPISGVKRSVGVVEAASSSLVTQTISSVHNRPYGFGMDTRLFFCLKILFLLLPCRFSARLFLWGQAVRVGVDLCWYSSVRCTLAYAVCSPLTYRIATPCLVSIRTGVCCTYGTSIPPTNR